MTEPRSLRSSWQTAVALATVAYAPILLMYAWCISGHGWVLRAPVGTGLMNWDVWLFFPNKDYPSSGYGGWIERIADWAYVHE